MRDFVIGVRYFCQGFGLLARRPRLLLTGMLPAVLTTVILLGGIVALVLNAGHLAALVTPFANDWPAGERTAARLAAGFALVGGAALLGIVGFTAVTLVVGGPFYERIAERIEDELGVTQGHLDLSWTRQLLSGIRDGIVLLLRSVLFTIPLFLAGFVPVVGQTLVPVLVALVTAWFMALEVVAARELLAVGNRRNYPLLAPVFFKRSMASTISRSASAVSSQRTIVTHLPFSRSL